MDYRILGRTGLNVSVLGFGCMRFILEGDRVVDEIAIPLLHRAVERGVNYFDTAVGYCRRDSQRVLGDAFHDMRDKVILSTKNPHKDMTDPDTWWKNLEDSLRLLRTDHIDCYHMHGLRWEQYVEGFKPKGGLLDALLKARDQGMVRHIGYSSHDTAENIMKLADEGVFEFCTMQYNLLNRLNEQAIAHLHEKNIGVIIMGPVAGGRLANQTVEGKAGSASSAALALKFVLSNPGVTVAISGMNTMEMLEENVALASEKLVMTGEESNRVERAAQVQKGLLDYYCTACGYCMPCPAGVDIPDNFTLAQLDHVHGMKELAVERYSQSIASARYCVECGECLEKCPQNLEIPTHLRRFAEDLDPDFGKPAVDIKIPKPQQDNGGMRFNIKVLPANLSDQEISGEVTLEAAGIERLREEVSLKSHTHKRIETDVLIRPEEAKNTLPFHAVFEGAAGRPDRSRSYNLLFAHRVNGTGDVTPDQEVIQGAKQLIEGDPSLLPAHRTHFRVAHDEKDLIVVADVDEDLLGPAKIDAQKPTDGIELFFDCRPEHRLRRGPYNKGCAHIRLIPAFKENAPRIDVIKAFEMDFSSGRLTARQRAEGYRLEFRLSLSAFNLPEGQRVFGFDVAQFSVNAEGKQDLWLIWSGGPWNLFVTRGFGLLYLE